MKEIYDIYNQFIGFFPSNIQWMVSVVLALLLIYGVFQILKKNFIYIILVLVLLPASLPILKDIWGNIVVFIKFLLTKP